MNDGALAHRRPCAALRLLPRKRDQVVQHGACDAERDAGEHARVGIRGRENVERGVEPALRGGLPVQRQSRFDEQVLDGVALAPRSPETHHVPVVCDRRPLAAEQRGTTRVDAVRIEPRTPVRLVDLAVSAEPGRMLRAARELPGPVHAVAAIGRHRGALRAGAPGEHRVRRAEDLAGGFLVEKRRRHRAAERLAETPRGARVGARDDLGHRGEHRNRQLVPSDMRGQRQPEQPAFVKRLDHVGGQLPLRLDRRRPLPEQGSHRARPLGPGAVVGSDGGRRCTWCGDGHGSESCLTWRSGRVGWSSVYDKRRDQPRVSRSLGGTVSQARSRMRRLFASGSSTVSPGVSRSVQA